MDNFAGACPLPLSSGMSEAWRQYCNNFNAMKGWFRHHYAFNNSAPANEEGPAQEQPSWQPVRSRRRNRIRPGSARWRRRRKALYRRNRRRSKGAASSAYDETEIDDEFLSFLMVSQLHRQNREAMKAEAKKEEAKQQSWLIHDGGDYVDVERVSIYYRPSTEQDLRAPIADRRSVAKMSYGTLGDRIYELEEEMQAKFDREIDKYNSPLWPATPLRL